MKNQPNRPSDDKMTLLQVAQSVLAAAFGVQSSRNRERDFKRGSARTFILAGLVGTVLFVVAVWGVVSVVMKVAVG
jgi:hypothetical protein